jgi:S-adenosylhomocysteine hydrolase
MDLRLLAIVTAEGRVINLALASGAMGILKSSWVFIASKEDP